LSFLKINAKLKDHMANCFVTTVPPERREKLREDLLQQGFSLSQPPYTLFSAQKPGVSCTLYTSGKLTVQGKGSGEFITFYLEPEILGALPYSHPEAAAPAHPHIGIDESGKGDYFGPLCIAGVQANEAQIQQLLALGVRDSKALSDDLALKLSGKIRALCPHSIVSISPSRYNELYKQFTNLNRLLAWGHATAIGELVEKTGCTEVLIDQFANEHVVERALQQKQLTVQLTQRTKAESDPVVAAASILARAAFLHGLQKLSSRFGITLPKGASNGIVRTGKLFVAKEGREQLGEVAKLHFKTTGEILA
jgi:ribonuclease HIII